MKEGENTPEKVGTSQEWHSLPSEQVLEMLETRWTGLTNEEVIPRSREHGANVFTRYEPPGVFARIAAQLKSPIVFVLLAAFVVTLLLSEFVDAAVIAFALLIAIAVGVVQEGRASRAFDTLARSQSHSATVLRNGGRHVVDAGELVPGDIVEIADGMQAPADLRLIETKKLALNEATLTGEWLAVDKQSDEVQVGAPFTERTNMAWMGTFVARGHGLGVVVATGDRTFVGGLAKDIGSIKDEATPLQREMERISRIMLVVIGAVVMLIFALGVFRGEPLEEMLLTSIAVAVASIPEGLPAAVTIILAVAMESLLRRGGLVRNLLAAETLGSTTFILTDKTGTLTEARMEITRAICLESEVERNNDTGMFEHSEALGELLDVSLTATDAFIDEDAEGEQFKIVGEPMERAILKSAHDIGIPLTGESSRGRRMDYLAFTSENRFAAGLAPHYDAKQLCINGAPEYLLARASGVHTREGIAELTDERREHFARIIEEHTSRGARLIGVAYRIVDWEEIPGEVGEGLLDGIVFMGLLVFYDPVRAGVHEAIDAVTKAGARIVLVTGDNPRTALSVATATGIAKEGDTALLGDDIEAMNDKELYHALQTVSVFARVLPREKMRLAEVLQQHDEIVAMTGDGINDSPALKRANIGIAIGSGTEVAKEASDLVLVNDSFAIIRSAIEEGRRVFMNLRKIIGYLMATSLSEVSLIATALIVGGPVPLVPAQILWSNIMEEGLMSVAFAFEPGEKEAMLRKPQDIRKEGVLSRDMIWFLGIVIFVLSTLLIGLYLFFYLTGAPLEEIRSVMFLAVSIDSLFISFSFRSLTQPLWKVSLRTNMFFLVSFLVSLALLFVVLTIPFMQFILSYEPLPLFDVILIVLFGFATLITVELAKWAFFERRKGADVHNTP